jgi:tetratricopeptide (TPR) repeat protein
LGGALKEGDTADALEALYHKRLDEIEADLRLYLRDGTINTMIFDIQLPKEVDTPEVETSAGLSARLALAEMLSNTRGRDGHAGAAYAALAREYPNRPEIEEGWGRLCGHQHKPGDAIRHYARAVELGGKDPRLFLEYSRILYISDRLADAIDTLEKAARLNPDNDEIRFELGSAYMQHGNYKEAAAELHTVKNVQPAHAYRYYYDMAFSEYRLGQTAEAKVHAAKARAVTNHPGELATLDGLDHALEAPAARADEAGPAIASATGDSAGATDTGRQGPAQASATPQDQTVSATPTVHSVEGLLEHLECGEFARLHVRVDGRIRIFVITDSLAVNMRDRHGAPVYLQCGPQKPPRALRIEYQAQPGQPDAVRLLEFK